MKIFVTGTRGIPNIPGGVEKHCQDLYPLIAAAGHEVIVATRIPYVKARKDNWQRIRLLHLYAPHKKSLEAIVHTFLAVLSAWKLKADIIHIHAIGPGLLVPVARLLGLRVVVTNHGPDYDRQKWGVVAKTLLRLGEYLGGRFASEVIVISTVIAGIIQKRCNRKPRLIYNGVNVPDKVSGDRFLKENGICSGEYILSVARFVPEKGLHDLIEAFKKLDGKIQLVLAGDADHETEYSRILKKEAAADERIVLTGYITGEDLDQVFLNARLFVLPSYHEGLPIALLEALSYGLSVLVSDIPANREVKLLSNRFFQCGDIPDLVDKIKLHLNKKMSVQERSAMKKMIEKDYNWQTIAQQTIEAYKLALN